MVVHNAPTCIIILPSNSFYATPAISVSVRTLKTIIQHRTKIDNIPQTCPPLGTNLRRRNESANLQLADAKSIKTNCLMDSKNKFH